MSSLFVQYIDLDSKLFNIKVGRIELNEEDLVDQRQNPSFQDILLQAYSSGYRLIYIFKPSIKSGQSNLSELTNDISKSNQSMYITIPGIQVDIKTSYTACVDRFDKAKLCNQAYTNKLFRVRKYDNKNVHISDSLIKLALASGMYSRFKVDHFIPNDGYEAMFTLWLKNSLNKTIADEIFVAYSNNSGSNSSSTTTTSTNDESESNNDVTIEIGFITVRKVDANTVSIGLLAVSDLHRRKGIAHSLLSRVVLWILEEYGTEMNITVITQGSNKVACTCYETFGFELQYKQEVNHLWLPEHLTMPLSQSDQRHTIPFCKQYITGKESIYINQLLSSGLDSSSHFTLSCSSKIQHLLGQHKSERILMVHSGTAALELAALLCDLQYGDEVIMPSYTFSSTANAFVLRGAVPVFVDVCSDTLNIDENHIEAAITSRTKAICVVHYAGIPCEMDTICALTEKYKLFLIEDAAQAFMSTYKGQSVGTFGHFGCFSFHYTKNIICGEGGALCINRNLVEKASKAMVIWEKGTNRHDFMMGKIDKYEWIDVGSSYVPNEMACAILLAQLECAQTITARRLAHYELYQKGLSELVDKGIIRIPTIPADCQHNAHIFYIILSNEHILKHVQNELKSKGISAFTHYIPLHSSPAGLKYGKSSNNSNMIVTNQIYCTLLRLPIWIDMTITEIQFVIDAIKEIVNNI